MQQMGRTSWWLLTGMLSVAPLHACGHGQLLTMLFTQASQSLGGRSRRVSYRLQLHCHM